MNRRAPHHIRCESLGANNLVWVGESDADSRLEASYGGALGLHGLRRAFVALSWLRLGCSKITMGGTCAEIVRHRAGRGCQRVPCYAPGPGPALGIGLATGKRADVAAHGPHQHGPLEAG